MASQTYSSIAASGTVTTANKQPALTDTKDNEDVPSNQDASHREPQVRRSPSPSHKPKTGSEDEESVHVLTLMADQQLHHSMNALRHQYFPPRLNKLSAHLTLFHALPGSKLEKSIIPVLQSVAAETSPFELHASHPFRLKKGIGISVSNDRGGSKSQKVHQRLQQPWKHEGFLSDQDAGGFRAHWTIMNKVDDEAAVLRALDEVKKAWKPISGTAEGLGLWRYDRGKWRWEKGFYFETAASS